ncbi:MAG: DUF2284 domain-containing protein [Deltaproteobacteria bacterium]|jgi:predicted metal-binding protein|nr:DUF2284 domain-containing protein [Deltaproteobacteria bacterium]
MIDEEKLSLAAKELGASSSGFINVSQIVFRQEFRKLCEANRCGSYDRGWMCPPAVGDIEELIEGVKKRSRAMVFSSVGKLVDSFDYKGMVACGQNFAKLVQKMTVKVASEWLDNEILVLGAGPCRVCEKCAYLDNQSCLHPEQAVMSLEANGVDVGQLAKLAGLKYNNGPNTVTYFGAVFFTP